MATVELQRRVVNPGRRRRRANPSKKRLTLKQKLYFGTPAQRSAARRSLSGHRKRKNPARQVKVYVNPGRKRRTNNRRKTNILRAWNRLGRKSKVKAAMAKRRTPNGKAISGYGSTVMNRGHRRRKRRVSNGKVISGYGSTVMNKGRKRRKHNVATKKRRKNIGAIVSYGLGALGANPGRKQRKKSSTRRTKNMARRKTTRKRRASHRRRRTSYSRRNPGLRALLGLTRRKRRSTQRMSGRRRTNYGRRGRRRNPGAFAGTSMTVFGAIGGAYLTALINSSVGNFLPTTGILGYVVTGAIAYLQGYLVSRFAGKPALGHSMQNGGYIYLALKLLNDFAPGIAAMSPFGLRGALAQSSFYTPQVPMGNSFTSFVTPRATANAVMAATSLRGRTGRIN